MNPQLTNIQYCVWNIHDIAGHNPDVAIHIDHIRVNAQYLAGEVATLNREQAALIEAMGNKDIEILDKDALIAELQRPSTRSDTVRAPSRSRTERRPRCHNSPSNSSP